MNDKKWLCDYKIHMEFLLFKKDSPLIFTV